jgi:chromosome segregation ATPase
MVARKKLDLTLYSQLRTDAVYHFSQELGSKRSRLESVGRKLSGVKRKVDEEFGHLDTLEKRMAELAQLASAEEARLKAVKKEVEELKDKQLKASKELHGLRVQEKELVGEIGGAQVQSRNMAAKIRQLDQELAKQQETLYTADFNIQVTGKTTERIQNSGEGKKDR